MKFSEIPGQTSTKQALIKAYRENHMAHAQLFASVEGGAALPLAWAYIQFIFCENREEDSCGTCANCLRIQKGIHPDVHFFFPKPNLSGKDGESKEKAAMQTFRDFLQKHPFGLLEDFISEAGFGQKPLSITKEESRRIIRTVSMKAVEQNMKVLLIWMPEFFHPSAANAILKVLEEPPAHTLYLMVSHAYDSLLSTIRSRMLLFNIPPYSNEEVREWLVQEEVEDEKAQALASLSEGSLGRAMLNAKEDTVVAHVHFRDWMLDCLGNQYNKLLDRADSFGKNDKWKQVSELTYALSILRETLIANQPIYHERQNDPNGFIFKFNRFLSLEHKEKMYQELNMALIQLARNANAKMVHFHLSTVFTQFMKRS
jgi:DNA polymerase-3 subunit delta'